MVSFVAFRPLAVSICNLMRLFLSFTGLVYSPKCLPRSTTSEETSSGASQYTNEVASEETSSGVNKYTNKSTSEETSSGANQYTIEATSEETSTGTNQYTGENLDSVITFEDVSPVEKKSDNDVLMTGATEEGPPVDEENSLISEFLDKLNVRNYLIGFYHVFYLFVLHNSFCRLLT